MSYFIATYRASGGGLLRLFGWLLPFVISPVFTAILPPHRDIGFVWVRLGLTLMGAMIGLPQRWVLRQQVRHAACWILAYGFGWGMIGLINRQTSEPLAVLFALAVMPAIATGLACWLLLDWFPKHESEEKVSGH